MSHTDPLVVDDHGARGELVDAPDPDADRAVVQLDEGRQVRIDRRRLAPREDGGYHYDGAFPTSEAGAETVEEHRIPVARERASVRRETRETGRVRIKKSVHEHTETIDEPVHQEHVSVERVPVDRVVEEAPPVREEEGVLIIPVVEERLVVTRQLVVTEEVHVTRQQREEQDTRTVTLRHEEVDVEREERASDAPDNPDEAK